MTFSENLIVYYAIQKIYFDYRNVFQMSCVQKYLVGFLVLTGFAALTFAGGEDALSFPTPLENYGDDEILEK